MMFNCFLKNNNKGFTLLDVMLVGAVIAILIVMTFPMMTDFLLLQNEKKEEEVQNKIISIMHDMAEQEFRIPLTNNIATFASETQLYGDYFASEIIEDSFRNNRYYRAVSNTEVFRDASFNVHYAVLYSTGTDGCWGKGLDCVSATINSNLNGLFGTDPDNYDDNFKIIDVPDGDYLVKFTDRRYQMQRYEKTKYRLDRLTEALAQYGQLKKYQGVAEGISASAIYFPPSQGPISDSLMITISASSTGVTSEIETELDDLLGIGVSDVIINDDDTIEDKEDRRLSMIALTRVLGLPVEFCCNAMQTFIDSDGDRQEEAFFYYSNPLPRINPSTDTCGTAASTITARKLPPRITVDEDVCGK